MAINEELVEFVKASLEKGYDRLRIEEVLLSAGWNKHSVRRAIDSFADIDFPIPVPRPKPYVLAQEAFLYLVMFTTMAICAVNIGSLIFTFIDILLPDGSEIIRNVTIRSRIQFPVSALTVSLPIFIFVTWLGRRWRRSDSSRPESKIKKWLTYLMLFFATTIIVSDFTALVYNFIGDALTARFVLKAITVAIIAGSIFFYYGYDLWTDGKALRDQTRSDE